MVFNEDSRVKLPSLVHFIRLGYQYQTKKNQKIDKRNNIFVDIFKESICRINGREYKEEVLNDLIKEIAVLTDNVRDKGREFYERLTNEAKIKLIDFRNPENNDFRVVTELEYYDNPDNPDEHFRPDINILINGIPLAFFEVKKPNNEKGMQAEFSRMKYRTVDKAKEFGHFFNQLQILAFSNNMAYDDGARVLLQGSFYTTPNGKDALKYNHFREESAIAVNEYVSDDVIDYILSDNNAIEIKNLTEFKANVKSSTYANKFATSLFSKERLIFFIRYGIAFVDSSVEGYNKHIMRYPQYFAAQKLIDKLDGGMQKATLWHTQGSGKTAWAYFVSRILKDYYAEKHIVPKFYFVVDRLDLLKQAKDEFSWRGMSIASIDNRNDFSENIRSSVIKEDMNVVNIQKFSEDSKVVKDVNKSVQRIYFLDEVHRGYKPKGTFLANLLGADKNGIFIGLTGTPLLKKEASTKDLFSDGYIHKYYYNKSIADGYTLKIKKENISVEFRNLIAGQLKDKKGKPLKEGDPIPSNIWNKAISDPEIIKQLCAYIDMDFKNFIDITGDKSLGFMIVTAKTGQAVEIQKWFEENTTLKTALVLSEEEDNTEKQEGFRGVRNPETKQVEAKYEGVIVYNMLLTGFDAPRLKRLYLLRQIKEHSLLQTLARVNRPYKGMKYGYVVDFVDITEEYEKTNERYLEELKEDLPEDDDFEDVKDIFIDIPAVKRRVVEVRNNLFNYLGNVENNLEAFVEQVNELELGELRDIRSELNIYKECYNELRMSHEDVSDIPIERLQKAENEVQNRIRLIIAEKYLDDELDDEEEPDFTGVIIDFIKNGEMFLEFTSKDDVIEKMSEIDNAISANLDPTDAELLAIKEDYKQAIKDLKDGGKEVADTIVDRLSEILKRAKKLNVDNTNLSNIYQGDDSCMRIHKRFRENYGKYLKDPEIMGIIRAIIVEIDNIIGHMQNPTQEVVKRALMKPVRDVFKEVGHNLGRAQVGDVINLFIEGKIKE